MADKKSSEGLKLSRAEDAKKAVEEYNAKAKAVDENMERLRKLRLEREAAEAETKKNAPPKRKPAKGGAKAKASSATLSQWLTDQQSSGRRS